MTNAQLNSAIRKLGAQLKDGKIDPHSETTKAEFTRLHGADNTFKALSPDSMRIMMVLNRRYHYISPSYFGPDDY